jgi:hypothetical protein
VLEICTFSKYLLLTLWFCSAFCWQCEDVKYFLLYLSTDRPRYKRLMGVSVIILVVFMFPANKLLSSSSSVALQFLKNIGHLMLRLFPDFLSTFLYVGFRKKVSLCCNWALLHEGVLGDWRYSSTHFLTSALDGGEWSASRPGRFTPRESPWCPLDRRLGGPQSRSGRGGEEKNSQPPPRIEP